MSDAMVTGRMPLEKKMAGNAVLHDAGLTASQAINILYSKLIEDRSAALLKDEVPIEPMQWEAAARFVDGLSRPRKSRFDSMTDAEIRMERLKSRGLA